MQTKNIEKRLLYPILLGFFISGYSDIAAPLTGGIIIEEFSSEQSAAVNFLPSMAFLWFLFLSTPIAAFMNRRGRKLVAMIGFGLSVVGLALAFGCSFFFEPSLAGYFAGFGVLGLGNTFVQMAINPLLATIVPKGQMTSYLTIGQIVRNCSLLIIGPLALGLAAWTGWWQWALVVYAVVSIAGAVWMSFTPIPEPQAEGRAQTLSDCFKLLKNKVVLISTLGIGAFIMADVGVNFVGGQLIHADSAILSSTGFYACRILGTVVGYFVLVHYSDVKYLRWNMTVALVLALVMLFMKQPAWIYGSMALMGFLVSCVFATFFAVAVKSVKANESNGVAGLMILAISAGAITCPLCGALIDLCGGVTSMGLLVPLLAILYMLWASWQVKAE